MDEASDMETQGRFGVLCTRVKAPGVHERTLVSVAYLRSEFTETDAKTKARQHLRNEEYDCMSVLPWTHPAMKALNVSDEFLSLRKTDGNGTGLPPLWPPNCPPPFPRSTSRSTPGFSSQSRDGPYTPT